MRFSWIFTLIGLILLAVITIAVMLPEDCNPIIGWIAKTVCGLSLLLLIVFHRNIMKPIRSISNGFNLLKAQDFSSRLSHVDQHEADKIIDMFNRMMSALKEERLHMREQNHFLDLLINVSPMGIIILDNDGRIATANPSASAFLDFDKPVDLRGIHLDDLDSPLGHTIAGLEADAIETVRFSDSMIYRCSRLSFMNQGFAHPFLLIEKLTDEVMKAEKKSYEKVIRVIAHEVNNTMAGVNSMLSTAESVLEENPKENADILEVINVCEGRCQTMSQFITSFANVVKIPEANLGLTDLNKEINRWKVLLESICHGRDIDLTFDLCDNRLPVQLDTVLMEQVMINIIKNSAESIGHGGKISVATTATPPTLTVTDDGPGISDETAKMLFSPFFSTKVNGHGIGLLFISEVLHKHGCKFSLTTSPADHLTRFKIQFKNA
ncbi:MAG: ATP-binding protein [Bacteroides sp.]|nr:ATP-binding protein [Bacteroides sp.]